MTTHPLFRALTVIGVMVLVGLTWFPLRLAWLKKKGTAPEAARKQASVEARQGAMIAAFLYMLFMLSLVRFL